MRYQVYYTQLDVTVEVVLPTHADPIDALDYTPAGLDRAEVVLSAKVVGAKNTLLAWHPNATHEPFATVTRL